LRRNTNTLRRFCARVDRATGVGSRASTARLWAHAFVVVLSLASATAAETTSGIDVAVFGDGLRLLSPQDRLVLWDRDEGAPGPRAAAERSVAASQKERREDDRTTPGAETSGAETSAPATPEQRPELLLTSLISAGVVLGSAVNSFLDGSHQRYHFANEGWFGENTHNGGADKVAHFVDYYLVSKEAANIYVALGHKPERARWLGLGVSALAGLVTEIGDGTTRFGFSYQDFVMDVGGAASAALISALNADDLIGVRHGFVKSCCAFSSFSSDYDNEIFTADWRSTASRADSA
jgi:hypothetical protein